MSVQVNLREVAPLDTRQMQQDLATACAPSRTKALIQATLTTLPSPSLAATLRHPSAHPHPPGPPPWALPDWEGELRAGCGVAEAGVGGLPPLLQGSLEVSPDRVC